MDVKKLIWESIEIERTMPIEPYRDNQEAELARQMKARRHAILEFVSHRAPAPAEEWKPTVPPSSDEDRERFRRFWNESFRRQMADHAWQIDDDDL